MDQKNNLLNGLFSSGSHYFELQGRSVKLGFYQKSTQAITGTIQLLILLVFGVVTYLFLNIGCAFLIGTAIGSLVKGFFIVGGINLLFFIVYVFARHKLGEKRLRNSVLQGISGNLKDYDALVAEHMRLQSELTVAEKNLRKSASEIREKIEQLETQVTSLKTQLLAGNTEGGSIARTAVNAGIEILLNTSFLKNAGIIKRTLVPVLTNAFVTSRLFRDKKKSGLFENLKTKILKVLR